MRKSDKKLDNQIRLALTDVCESALKSLNGFEWLTHSVNYDRFPESLKVVCVFDTNEHLGAFNVSPLSRQLERQIHAEFNALGVKVKNIQGHVFYDTEENCEQFHNGNWARRLQG
ncbi:hypothetical protein [Marinomonas posidonica]|uniref:Fis family transcriptional regulator n=1 Tax=Marinomonas posidonica (strain CECT 7376 / NCIMB 14433 / IVIA-Po-181) TaxID=491952 RepID=F6CUN2_MARPP|nr:hypothetical protein [Marinomonas posidonica]AEF54142.1 hypothetical protein Mar181_1094 [Marinomonas posidonica IVIA-Po-181]